MKEYDMIIIGAGPAGLLLGKELSKTHNILILEKNKIGETNKSWLTYENRWEKEKFPKSLITNKFNKWKSFIFEQNYTVKDKFICIDEKCFLKYLAKIITNNNSDIFESFEFKNFKRKDNCIIIENKFSTKLLIDCSGTNSVIVKKYNLIKEKQYYNCYGFYAKFKRLENQNYYAAFDTKNSEKLYFGVTKIAPKTAFLLYFNYSEKEINPNLIKKYIAETNTLFNIKKYEIIEEKITSYFTGTLKTNVLDNIFLFGDAGGLTPSFIGMGFNEILRQHEKIAKHLSSCLIKNKLNKKDLKIPENIEQDISNHLMEIISFIQFDPSAKSLSELVEIVKTLPNSTLRKIYRNDISKDETVKVLKLILSHPKAIKLITKIKKKHILKIIKVFLKIEQDIFEEDIHNLIFKHHQIKIKDMYN